MDYTIDIKRRQKTYLNVTFTLTLFISNTSRVKKIRVSRRIFFKYCLLHSLPLGTIGVTNNCYFAQLSLQSIVASKQFPLRSTAILHNCYVKTIVSFIQLQFQSIVLSINYCFCPCNCHFNQLLSNNLNDTTSTCMGLEWMPAELMKNEIVNVYYLY